MELDAQEPAPRDRGHEPGPVLRLGEDRVSSRRVGLRRRTSGRSRSRRRRGSRRRPGDPTPLDLVPADVRQRRRAGEADGSAGAGSPRVSAPSSSLPSNRSCSPRQIPRYGRSDAIQSRIGSTNPPARRRSIAGAAAPTPGTTSRSGSAMSAALAARWTRAPAAVSACSIDTRLPAP